jgi:general secretion pathway protein G
MNTQEKNGYRVSGSGFRVGEEKTQRAFGVRRATRSGGFTLIELLLVLVILGILAGIVVPKFMGRSEQARIASAQTTISNVGTALEAFEVDNGRYPTTAEGLKALVEQPAGLDNWKGPYLKTDPGIDPWKNAFIYKSPGDHDTKGFDLYSAGPNGQEGDTDDLTSWGSK